MAAFIGIEIVDLEILLAYRLLDEVDKFALLQEAIFSPLYAFVGSQHQIHTVFDIRSIFIGGRQRAKRKWNILFRPWQRIVVAKTLKLMWQLLTLS